MDRQIQTGAAQAGKVVTGPFPATGSELLHAALTIHKIIFQNAQPEAAGQLRTGDVYFGTGVNEMKGAPPAEIEKRFAAMDIQLPLLEDRAQFAAWGARMLHRFLAIHPFEDGNGRVARRLLEWGVESGDRWALVGHNRTSPREVRKYLQALEYAHRHAPNSESPRARSFVNHLTFLTKWLEVCLAEMELEEAPEPLLAPEDAALNLSNDPMGER